MHTYIHTYIHTYVRTYVDTYAHIYIYIYIYIHVHTLLDESAAQRVEDAAAHDARVGLGRDLARIFVVLEEK